MKKILLLFITYLFLAFCLISCADNNKDNTSKSPSSSSASHTDEASTSTSSVITSSDSSSESPLSAESEQALKDEMSRLIDELIFND